jgi:DNA N-6-adenine-methyltransferase (Dam)/ASCH domain
MTEHSTSLPLEYLVRPFPDKDENLQTQTIATASPISSALSPDVDPDGSLSKMSPDCSMPQELENPKVHSLNDYSATLPNAGMWGNGWYCPQPCLDCPTIESDCLSLPTPTALSSLNSRPPGQNKLEVKLKQLGLIQTGEVANPDLLEAMFGLPMGYSSPLESKKEIVLPVVADKPSEIPLPLSARSQFSDESSISIPSSDDTIIELQDSFKLKAISLWQPWASLISLGLKHYETRSWKTNYRGKLLICSTAANSKQHKEYLKICEQLQLPPWENFLHGRAIALCDLTDCIEMTPEFIEQQSRTEILCGDWQVGRYAWKLENIQPIAEPFAVKGKQGLFDISLENYEFSNQGEKGEGENPEMETVLFQPPNPKLDEGKKGQGNGQQFNQSQKSPKSKPSDRCYTPPHIIELIVRVLGAIDLDPCADDGKHVPAGIHYTVADDGLSKPWHGRIFFNPPYSCPGKWIAWFLQEYAAGRAIEAIALLPAATDTNWLSPILKAQPVCFWKGRIKFLDENYQPMRSGARQSHVFVYWGENWEKFKEVFDPQGFVSVPNQFLEDKLVEQISSRKDADDCESFLKKLDQQQISGETAGSTQFLEDKQVKNQSSRNTEKAGELIDEEPDNNLVSNEKHEFLEDINYSSRKNRRNRGEGSGCIYYRTVIKKGKEYYEAYYQYELWSDGNAVVKSTKYIPKRLLQQIQELDIQKVPVWEILQVLGVFL